MLSDETCDLIDEGWQISHRQDPMSNHWPEYRRHVWLIFHLHVNDQQLRLVPLYVRWWP